MAVILECAEERRRVTFMLLDYPFRNVLGVVQCAVYGCSQQIAIPAEVDTERFLFRFMREHECTGVWDTLKLGDLFTTKDE